METKFSKFFTENVIARLAELGYDDIESFLEDKTYHSADGTGNPSVYCGTYGKYNDGNLSGQWIDLTTFCDYDEFINYCKAIHADEIDPELMFQDYNNMPSNWFDEDIDEDSFDRILEYVDLVKHYDEDSIQAYIDLYNPDSLENFTESFRGEYDSGKDFAIEMFYEIYGSELKGICRVFEDYFDFDRFADDLFSNEYSFQDGYVFLDL